MHKKNQNVGLIKGMIHKNAGLEDSNNKLSNSFVTDIDFEGIPAGTLLTKGTSFEDILLSMLVHKGIGGLTFDGYSQIVKCGEDIANPVFSWDIDSPVDGMTLSDNLGVLNSESVSGESYISSVNYNLEEPGEIIWTLNAPGIGSVTLKTVFVIESYYGLNETGEIPTEEEILNGNESLSKTEESIRVTLNTSANEYGWIAVPNEETGRIYSSWYVSDFNKGNIAEGNFIQRKGQVTVNGKVYDIYMYSWSSELSSPLKLS